MIETIKQVINQLTAPQISFTFILLTFFFIFPPTDALYKLNKKLGIHKLWTNTGAKFMLGGLFLFFVFGMTDANFRSIVAKPDNVPIIALLFLVVFFLWLSLKQAYDNDARIAEGKGPNEAEDAKQKVLVWPDLVYIELIAMVAVSVLLLGWAVSLSAPLEAPANPTVSPNPSKAPWYFLGLQEMLVYFDPWIAGVLFPAVIVKGFMAIPFIDNNPKGSGYYTFKDRKMAISIFLFLFLALWIFLISTGTFLRGPNWNFFGPFEYWDHHKLEALTNVNLSELVYMVWQNKPLPSSIFLREIWGFLLVGVYFVVTPAILTVTFFKKIAKNLGPIRYSVFIVLLLLACSLPIKMYLRWVFNIKYLVAIPEFFFNI
ncbi:MAG: hypothetical protein ACI9F2_001104 [Lysobacterales bacterium]|jgi:hypothetical protein